jgi:hypothetical protein
VVSAVATLSVACLIVVFTLHSLPDFSDPQLVSDAVINNHVHSFIITEFLFSFCLFLFFSQRKCRNPGDFVEGRPRPPLHF